MDDSVDPMRRGIYGRPAFRGGRALSYAETIQILKRYWDRIHPDVPMVPLQGPQDQQFPCLVYRLESRQPINEEPKARLRTTYERHPGILIKGQRFLNIVSFSAMTKSDPVMAEAIIDEFEDFMEEMIVVLKAGGVQELFYNRRFMESNSERNDADVSSHAVAYNITTEKITVIQDDVIEAILIDVRTWFDHTQHETELATPDDSAISVDVVDQFQELATPDSD